MRQPHCSRRQNPSAPPMPTCSQNYSSLNTILHGAVDMPKPYTCIAAPGTCWDKSADCVLRSAQVLCRPLLLFAEAYYLRCIANSGSAW